MNKKAKIMAATVVLSFGVVFSTNSRADTRIEWPIAEGGNGHSYQIVGVDKPITWDDAEAAAERKGGYLVTILSESENKFVFDHLVNNSLYWNFNIASPWQNQAAGPWIGASQPNNTGEWQWVNNEGFLSQTYSHWLPGEPNNFAGVEDAAAFYDTNNFDPPKITDRWNDIPRSSDVIKSYIVEYASPVDEPSFAFLFAAGLAVLCRSARKQQRRKE